MTMKKIRLELARTKDEPQGNSGHAYEFRAPLNAAGELDRKGWSDNKQLCTVRRYENGTEVESGVLLHPRGETWVFSYAPGTDDDEPIFKFSRHVFKEGEYVTITEHDGAQRTFRVVSVNDWHPAR
jgi:hypothetical protein